LEAGKDAILLPEPDLAMNPIALTTDASGIRKPRSLKSPGAASRLTWMSLFECHVDK
jgi:hypothetical protein